MKIACSNTRGVAPLQPWRGRSSLGRTVHAPRIAPARAGPTLTEKPASDALSPPEVPAPLQFHTGPWPTKRSFAEVFLDKTLDTLDDVTLHFRRKLLPEPAYRAQSRLARRKSGGMLRFQKKKPVVLVLGTGWGAHSLIKVIDTDLFDVVVVSPRNHFCFTPMLPSTAVGTVEFRSLLEPIRVANPFTSFFEADCDSVDVNRKVAICTSSIAYEDGERPRFEVPYDVLIVAVGEQPATYGVPGVREHAFFMKEITDCVGLRNRIQQCFELASLPGTPEQRIRDLLHFVIVGGGPTGVEFAGTLNDFVQRDLRRKFPELVPFVCVTLLQSGQAILTQFAAGLAAKAMENFEASGVEVRTGVRVVEVTSKEVKLKSGESIPYGLCVWSTGNAARPLVRQIAQDIPMQQAANEGVPAAAVKLHVDPYLRVAGARDVISLGDCCCMTGDRLPATAQVAAQQGAYVAHLLNRSYDISVGGVEQPPPMPAARRKRRAAQASALQRPGETGALLADPSHGGSVELAASRSSSSSSSTSSTREGGIQPHLDEISALVHLRPEPPLTEVTLEQFLEGEAQAAGASAGPASAASGSSSSSRSCATATPHPSTEASLTSFDEVQLTYPLDEAQLLRLSTAWEDATEPLPNAATGPCKPFEFLSLGILAYVGNDKALTQVDAFDSSLKLYGRFAFLLWRSVYITKQVSVRNRVLILFDWLKAKVFGRDLSQF